MSSAELEIEENKINDNKLIIENYQIELKAK